MECMRNQLHDGVVLNGRYETISPLNHGSFGMVFQAKDLLTGDNVAIKVITKPTASLNCPSTFAVDERSEELNVHLCLGSHPNIVNLVESFESQNHVYLVLEYCSNGDLYEAIRFDKGPLETEHVRDFMMQLVGAVEYCHAKGIYHRDIKPENIFLTQNGSMKLGDFGLATSEPWSWEIAVGSDRYMAPEQYDPTSAGYSTPKADIWAIGIVLLNVLFQRNPFAVPAGSDPLYADFALDRQSLFDVFPNMSQDTFEVIRQCLAIDPERRDLTAVKEALARAICFTTDDESLDEFCTEERDAITVGANREPLRTPSISTPSLDASGSFPWAKALAMSPPQTMRQLSVIHDTEIYSDDMYPTSYDVKPSNASGVSFVDSGLGLSFKSGDMSYKSSEVTHLEPINITRSRPVPISGSLPAKPFNSMASVFGKKRDVFSKSWSDLWDEEEEEQQFIAEIENNYSSFSAAKAVKPVVSEAGSGVSTPRGGLTELKNPATVHNSRSRSPQDRRATDHVSENTGFIFEEHQTSALARSSPSPKRSVADKWAALGDRRRGQLVHSETPSKPIKSPKQAQPSPTSARKRSRAGTWRRPTHGSPTQHDMYGSWEAKVDNRYKSKDWRQHPVHHVQENFDDIGDLEWVL
ncbi:kinase-like protein [Dothidotthia symphoricarpi CBS 119687]|uniref:Kinase-like protein n=1 Tax=Dothidotthia symphoricarpi CBS 119687 TaxID=1392245 RepID=A0A6A6AD15_9PLEO|nr:kinase-like protein [Dothidotthia symphoricarpi CBS 119687]KAF2129015.1 kinase-like protein [Dothidotthia symphoricarpi CBS 119687]